jgi:hypothetical protein
VSGRDARHHIPYEIVGFLNSLSETFSIGPVQGSVLSILTTGAFGLITPTANSPPNQVPDGGAKHQTDDYLLPQYTHQYYLLPQYTHQYPTRLNK